MSKPKIPSKRYPSDDLLADIGGEIVALHKGEWVEIRGGSSWGFQRSAAELTRLQSKPFNQLSEEDAKTLVRLLDEVIEFVAERVVAWDWTGMDGKPLPAPSVKVISNLTDDEVLWLTRVIRTGATPTDAADAEKNA